MNIIKFSHWYEKMPSGKEWQAPTTLMAVFLCNREELGELFVKYDTLFWDGIVPGITRDRTAYFYELPKGRLMVLLLITHNKVWTTIRRWTPQKEKYYRSIVGQDVKIEIKR